MGRLRLLGAVEKVIGLGRVLLYVLDAENVVGRHTAEQHDGKQRRDHPDADHLVDTLTHKKISLCFILAQAGCLCSPLIIPYEYIFGKSVFVETAVVSFCTFFRRYTPDV